MIARPIRPIFSLLAAGLMLLLAVAASVPAQAQLGGSRFRFPAEVQASLDPAVGFVGDTVRLDVTVKIDDTHYTYAMGLTATGPVPISFTLEDTPALVPIEGEDWREPAPGTKFDQGFNTNVEYHSGTVRFSRRFRVAESTNGEHIIKGAIRMQLCDATTCLPPRNFEFSAPLLVRGGSDAPSPVEAETETAGEPANDEPVVDGAAADQAVAAPAHDSAQADGSAAGLTITDPDDAFTPATAEAEQFQPEGIIGRLSSTDFLTGASLGQLALLSFFAGLIALLTPCVFPMIPITISLFTKRAADTTPKRVALAGTYFLSIVAGFALIGLLFALGRLVFGLGTGSAGAANNLAANPYMNLILAALFFTFALSLFGVFEIALPNSWANKLQGKSRKSGDYLSVILMAVVFVIISFTCTGPILGLLIPAFLSGEWYRPLVGITMFAVGFGLPFFVLGLIPQLLATLPKSGGWLNATKVTMGFLELALAFKFLSNTDLVWEWGIFTRDIVLAAWVTVSLLTTFYLVGMIRMPHDEDKPKVGAGRLLTGMVFGIVGIYMIPGLFGKPLNVWMESFLPPDRARLEAGVAAGGGSWGLGTPQATGAAGNDQVFIMNDLDRAQSLSLEMDKPLFIDFTGWTCTNCRLMEQRIFPLPQVRDRMSNFIKVALYTDDATVGEKYQQYQIENFNTVSLPFYAIVTPEGETLATFSGMTNNPDDFVRFLERGLNGRI